MKHLKRYNENKSWEDIRDIYLELEDNGFEVDVIKADGWNRRRLKYDQRIVIKKIDKKLFYYSEVKEVILRLKDYLGDDYAFTWVCCEGTNSMPIEPTETFDMDEKLMSIVIYFTEYYITDVNESVNDIKTWRDIHDICQELEDDGFTIKEFDSTTSFRRSEIGEKKNHRIIIHKGLKKRFSYSEVKETVLRLKDYLGDNYIRVRADRYGNLRSFNVEYDVDFDETMFIQVEINTHGIVNESLYLNESVNNDSISHEDLYDICLELIDDYYEIEVGKTDRLSNLFQRAANKPGNMYYYVDITARRPFSYKKVEEYILRISDYLGKHYRSTEVTINKKKYHVRPVEDKLLFFGYKHDEAENLRNSLFNKIRIYYSL